MRSRGLLSPADVMNGVLMYTQMIGVYIESTIRGGVFNFVNLLPVVRADFICSSAQFVPFAANDFPVLNGDCSNPLLLHCVHHTAHTVKLPNVVEGDEVCAASIHWSIVGVLTVAREHDKMVSKNIYRNNPCIGRSTFSRV